MLKLTKKWRLLLFVLLFTYACAMELGNLTVDNTLFTLIGAKENKTDNILYLIPKKEKGELSTIKRPEEHFDAIILFDKNKDLNQLKEKRIGAIIRKFLIALSQEVPIISTSSLLRAIQIIDQNWNIFKEILNILKEMLLDVTPINSKKEPDFVRLIQENICKFKEKWMVYENDSKDFVVLIPKNYINFHGNNIESIAGINQKKVHIIKEPLSTTVKEFKNDEKININNFIDLFLMKNGNEIIPKKRFYISGHGSEETIAGMNHEDWKTFLEGLEKINTEVIYIFSCYAGGKTMLEKSVIGGPKKRRAETKVNFTPPKNINFPIIFGSIGSVPVLDNFKNNFDKFFKKLNLHFSTKYPKMYLEKPPKNRGRWDRKVMLQDVIKALHSDSQPILENYPLIWFPGDNPTMRAIELENTEILTYIKLIAAQLKKSVITIPPDTKRVLLYPPLINAIIQIDASTIPQFISKITSNSCHIIKRIESKSSDLKLSKIIDAFTPHKEGFSSLALGNITSNAWIIENIACINDKKESSNTTLPNGKIQINNLIIYTPPTKHQSILNPVILLQSDNKYYSWNRHWNDRYLDPTSCYWKEITKKEFYHKLRKIINASIDPNKGTLHIAIKDALYAATSGHQTIEMLTKKIEKLFKININILK